MSPAHPEAERIALTPFEQRILTYLDQRGPTHRSHLAGDLSPPDSKTALHQNGSNGAVPLLVGSWCRRLAKAGFVRSRYRDGFYAHHEITAEGKRLVRTHLGAER